MPFVQTRALNIHYKLAGDGDNVVVLIHGNFASWRWWQPVLDRLPFSYRAYAPDLRGCGDTDHPRNGYTFENLSNDLHNFALAACRRELILPKNAPLKRSFGLESGFRAPLLPRKRIDLGTALFTPTAC